MSYSRFLECDVYTFNHVNGGLDCCGCRLRGDDDPYRRWYSVTEFEAHLREHVAAGHDVPVERIVEHIREDIAEGRIEGVAL